MIGLVLGVGCRSNDSEKGYFLIPRSGNQCLALQKQVQLRQELIWPRCKKKENDAIQMEDSMQRVLCFLDTTCVSSHGRMHTMTRWGWTNLISFMRSLSPFILPDFLFPLWNPLSPSQHRNCGACAIDPPHSSATSVRHLPLPPICPRFSFPRPNPYGIW
jgi:hypothetical protein